MSLFRKQFAFGLVALFSAALWGCAPPPPPPPTVVDITITAAPDANPDGAGRAAPVAVRIYQLASTAAFDKADFFLLYERDAEVLGADLVGKDELVLAPGESKQLNKELKPGTTSIGVVVAFRDVQNANWRGTASPPANQTTPIAVAVQALNVTVTMGPPQGGAQ